MMRNRYWTVALQEVMAHLYLHRGTRTYREILPTKWVFFHHSEYVAACSGNSLDGLAAHTRDL